MSKYDNKSANVIESANPNISPASVWMAPNSVAPALPIRDPNGNVIGGLQRPGCAPVQTVTTAIAIGTRESHYRVYPCTVAGGVTGVTLQKGFYDGQMITLTNRASTGGYTITFATSGTSNVANGTSAVVAILGRLDLTWDAAQALWY